MNPLLAICENWVRRGYIEPAARRLRDLQPHRLRGAERVWAGGLARRTGQLQLAFRLLGPLTRGRHQRAEAIGEYAIALILNGCVAEAGALVQKSETGLARAWWHFERWEFPEARPCLEAYLARERDPYFHTAGVVNLAEACLETDDHERAARLLSEARKELDPEAHARMLGNIHHLRARLFTANGDLERSDRELQRAAVCFGQTRVSDALLVERQHAINRGRKFRDPRPVERFRARAIAAGGYESARECDFEILRLRFRPALFERLYFGTPYPAYRARLERAFPDAIPKKTELIWGTPRARTLDLATGACGDERLPRLERRLLECLIRDAYAPPRVGALFGALFPGENYTVEKSGDRVHQALKRLRSSLRRRRIPLEIEEREARYHLSRSAPFAIRIAVDLRLHGNEPVGRLRDAFGASSFTSEEARAVLGFSKATVNRRLGEIEGLRRVGRGRATRFEFR